MDDINDLRPRNKTGNPNIKRDTKGKSTGPKTDIGKFNAALGAGFFGDGKSSKLLKRLMICKNCPLGAKPLKIYNRKIAEYVDVPVPAKCKFFSLERKKCILEVKKFLSNCRAFRVCEKHGWDELKIAEALAADTIGDAQLTRQVEILTKGHPAGYTHMYSELASRQVNELHKMKYGEINKNLNVNVDLGKGLAEAAQEMEEEERKKNGKKKESSEARQES